MNPWLGLVTVLCVLLHPATAFAQRVEVMPFLGYRSGGDFFERVTGQAVELDAARAIGGVLNVALRDGLSFEGLYSHQESRVTVPIGPFEAPTPWQLSVDHWLAGGRQEDWQGRARPYLTGLLGLTHYRVEGGNEIRFVMSAGGGLRLRPSSAVGLRLDGRVFATFAEVDGRAIACVPGVCLVAFEADVIWQGEVSVGVVVGF